MQIMELKMTQDFLYAQRKYETAPKNKNFAC